MAPVRFFPAPASNPSPRRIDITKSQRRRNRTVKELGTHGTTLARGLAALLGAGLFLFAWPAVGPALEALLGRATLLSAAFAMPGGALDTARQRYAPDLYQPDQNREDMDLPPLLDLPQPGEGSSLPDSPHAPPQDDTPAPGSSASRYPLPDWPGEEGEPPEIPEKYQEPLLSRTITGEEDNSAFCRYREGWVRNYTTLTIEEVAQVLEQPAKVLLEENSPEPQVLIYHTHTTESYEAYDGEVYDSRNNWRSQDNTANMAAVGEALAQELRKAGIGVIHDDTQHDYPAYNGAYDRSAATIQRYLEQYPTIQVAIDVHRDAVLYDDGSVLKTVTEVGGRKAAQLMVIAPYDDGTLGIPGWRENFRFGAGFTAAVEEAYPGLMRPVFFCTRGYNLGMTPDSLLFEFGTNGNTLSEAVYTARLTGPILADYLLGKTER